MTFKILKQINMQKYQSIIFIFLFVVSLSACGPLKYKPVDARKVSPNVDERVKKNIEEGRGFRLLGGTKKGGTFDFASSNYLWRATLDTIDFMPLASANYSGGIIVTDWYSESSNDGESIKISVRFLSNEIRSDAIDINVFLKQCDKNLNCVTSQNQGQLSKDLAANILRKAARYEKEGMEKNKKEKPYINEGLNTE
tara:strand:- start:2415 stop:3005 length:591 start_codon:yes stop_codon:yes gene_type:complete